MHLGFENAMARGLGLAVPEVEDKLRVVREALLTGKG